MELRLLIEPQFGADYEQQLAFVRAAERLGFSAVMRSDHFVNTSAMSGLPGPSDSWVTLAALARETSTIRLGTLMTSANFRAPSLLAVAVAQVDNMSKGRIELGLGAGWFGREHEAFGFPFPRPAERLERLREQLEIITGLWTTELDKPFSYDGRHYQLIDCPGLPKPYQQPTPPVIIGGGGPRMTPMLAARFASEFNIGLVEPDVVREQFGRVRAACVDHGRDPDSMVYSTATTVCCGRTQAEALRRVSRGAVEIDEYRTIGVAGTPAEVVERLLQYRDTGAQRCYLRILDIDDLEHLELIATEVAPAVAAQ